MRGSMRSQMRCHMRKISKFELSFKKLKLKFIHILIQNFICKLHFYEVNIYVTKYLEVLNY